MRDEKGKFVKGSSGNPNGRPKRAREEKYYEILINSVTFQDWAQIVRKAADQARRGDGMARKWLADYLVGQPEQDHNLDATLEILVKYYRPEDNPSS